MKTQQETQAIAEIEAARARGEDPFGDDDQDEQDEPSGNITTPTDEVVIDDDAETLPESGDEVPAEVTDEVAEDEPEREQRTTFKTDMPADYKEQRKTLIGEKAAVMKKLMDGEIDAEEFAVEEARISDSLEDLTAQRIRSETLHEANIQTQAQQQNRDIQRLIVKTKAEVDYSTDPKAQRQFDMALNAVSQDPDNAGKDYADILNEAHKVVLALRGVTSKGDKVEQAIKGRVPEGKPPVTLRNLPTAATPNANGDMLDQLGRLKGAAYEQAYAKLSPGQKRTLLDMD
jgi:hypothetical protein